MIETQNHAKRTIVNIEITKIHEVCINVQVFETVGFKRSSLQDPPWESLSGREALLLQDPKHGGFRRLKQTRGHWKKISFK